MQKYFQKNANSNKKLVKRVIETAVVYGQIPDYSLIKDKKNIIISSEIIDSNLLPVLPNIKLIVLSHTEIKKKSNKEGDFLYLRFRKIDIENWNARLTLDNTWAVSEKSCFIKIFICYNCQVLLLKRYFKFHKLQVYFSKAPKYN